jgi:hypothetical protein
MNKEFKLIVAGGRSFVNRQLMDESINQTIAELPDQYSVSIVSGMAKGADQLGHEWALQNKCKVYKYYADWDTYGKRAGYLRNQQMCDVADGLLAFWDGISKGTLHMITIARNKGIYVRVVRY